VEDSWCGSRLPGELVSVPARRLGYRPALDGVRAAAIIAVLGVHATKFVTGGFLGVDIFFVLSGFLITTLLIEEWQGHGRISLAHFYFRRALRLMPALVVALVGFLVITGMAFALNRVPPHEKLHNALLGVVVGITYVSNIAGVSGLPIPGAIGHLWSLATEEQFYLLWPPCLYFALVRRHANRRTIVLGLTFAIAVLVIHRLEMTLRGIAQPRLYFAPDGSFDLILIGCLAGLWFTSASEVALGRYRRISRILWIPLVGIVLMAIFTESYSDRRLYAGTLTVFAIVVAILILTVVVDERAPLAKLLSLPPLVYIGKVSYALYLWHQVLLGGILLPSIGGAPRSLIGVPLSFAAAAASYHLVERRFLRLKLRDRLRLMGTPADIPVGLGVLTTTETAPIQADPLPS
jgi:peptidoglycan/LPS O-acetylase OafA/YrhL